MDRAAGRAWRLHMSMTDHRSQTGRRTSLRLLLGIAAVAVAIVAVYGWASLFLATPGSEATNAPFGFVSPAHATAEDERIDYFPAQFKLRATEIEPLPPQF